MDDTACRQFFAQPTNPYHRQYEALRAVFVERRDPQDVAVQFGLAYGSLRQMLYEFRKYCQTPDEASPFSRDESRAASQRGSRSRTRVEQHAEVLRFVDFWQSLIGRNPEWLYFDSKLTTYAELPRLNEHGVYFATIRRRGPAILKRLKQRPTSEWTGAVIDILKRRQKHIRYLEEAVALPDYQGTVRQIAVAGLGREEPTLFLTNHFEVRPRQLIINYARRNGIEDRLGTNVNFFHLDCLSSEVRLNVDLDVTLTVIANDCYCRLARQLKGFEQAKPKQLYRKFVETGGSIEIAPNRRILVTFDRRSHNPILREATLDRNSPPIPWLNGYHVEFAYSEPRVVSNG